MKRRLVRFLSLALALAAVSCRGETVPSSGRLAVVASIFPLYDFAREIGGEDVSAALFIPPGVEAHTYEPTARDILALKRARVFLHAGGLMEPWAARVLGTINSPELLAVDAAQGIPLLTSADEDHEHDNAGASDGEHSSVDPHFWLDPVRDLAAVETIRDAFVQADPARAAAYARRADAYREKLTVLDRDIREGLAGARRVPVVFGGHNVFGYFGARYGMQFISPYAGFSPEAEPQARRLVELAARLKSLGLKRIYHEESIDPKTARTLALSTGAELVLLHGAHNVTPAEMQAGVSYLSIMRDNLAKLKTDPGLFPGRKN